MNTEYYSKTKRLKLDIDALEFNALERREWLLKNLDSPRFQEVVSDLRVIEIKIEQKRIDLGQIKKMPFIGQYQLQH